MGFQSSRLIFRYVITFQNICNKKHTRLLILLRLSPYSAHCRTHMPFTLSHMVLAPPIAACSGRHLPLAALAIGCMCPDLYRLFTRADFDFSHQWSSVYSFNLAIGLFFSILWYGLYRPFIYRLLQLEHPLQLHHTRAWLFFILGSCIAIMLGTATHIIWDGLTHVDFRSFIFEAFLSSHVQLGSHSYPIHRILQIACSVLSLPILVLMFRHYFKAHRCPNELPKKLRYYCYSVLLVSLCHATVAYFNYAQQLKLEGSVFSLYAYLGYAGNQFAQAFLISFSIGCILYRFMDYYDFFEHSRRIR